MSILPIEIIEHVVDFVDLTSDLVSLALTCKAVKDIIIPWHLEYSTIRVADIANTDYFWAHLNDCSLGAEKIRWLTLGGGFTALPPSLPPPDPTASNRGPLLESGAWKSICGALRKLKHLNRLDWHECSNNAVSAAFWRSDVWGAINQTPLKHLSICGFNHNPSSQTLQGPASFFECSNLETFSLQCCERCSYLSSDSTDRSHLIHLLMQSHNVTSLTLDYHPRLAPKLASSLRDCFYPKLRRLCLFICINSEEDVDSYADFLKRHETITDLDILRLKKTDASTFEFFPGTLPHLRRLTGTDASWLIIQLISTPLTTHEDQRPIEHLSGLRITFASDMVRFQTAAVKHMDMVKLKGLGFQSFGHLRGLREILLLFPNLTWLDLPSELIVDNLAIGHTNNWWVLTLSRLPHLEDLRTKDLLLRLIGKENLIRLIQDLVAYKSCPHIRRVDWLDHGRVTMTRSTDGLWVEAQCKKSE